MRRLISIMAFAFGVSLIAGCSTGPPTAADFCHTLQQQKAKYLRTYGHPSSSGLEDLVLAISAIGQWVPIFEALQKNSPPVIEPQVANIVDSLKREQDQVSGAGADPLGALAAGLLISLEASGSWQQVSDYASAHCGNGAGG